MALYIGVRKKIIAKLVYLYQTAIKSMISHCYNKYDITLLDRG